VSIVDATEGNVLCQLGEAVTASARLPTLAYEGDYAHDAPPVAWSPDNAYLASWRNDTVVTVTDVESGQVVHTLQAPSREEGFSPTRSRQQQSVFGIAWSQDGRRLAYLTKQGYDSRKLIIWNVSQSTPELVANVYLAESKGLRSPEHVLFSPDSSQILTGLGTKRLDVWDASSGKSTASIENDFPHTWASWLPDQRGIVFGSRSTVAVWRLASGEVEHRFRTLVVPLLSARTTDETIAVTQGRRILLLNNDLTLTSSWLVDPQTPDHILGVHADGRHQTGPGAEQLRVIVLAGNEQKLLTVQEFETEHGWRNAAP
jgi:WD40 repeat protein